MNNINDLQFHVGPFGEGRWIALTRNSPYLCLEAESKDALLGKVLRALAFIRKAALQIEQNREREAPRFQATEIISARELEGAA